MTIEIQTNIDTKKIISELLEKKKQQLEVALKDAVAEIEIRTKSARNAQGGRYKGLSPQYLKYKVKKTGRGAPDLNLSGDMLEAMDSKVETQNNKLVGTISVNSVEQAAKVRGNQANGRKFLELSNGQVATILNKLQGR